MKKNAVKHLIFLLFLYFLFTLVCTLLYNYIPILIKFSVYGEESFYSSLITNLHSGIIDFIFFTLILWFINTKSEDKKFKSDLKQGIANCRYWMSEEAAFKICGYLRTLQENEDYEIDLSDCMLCNSKLIDMKFENSKFYGAQINNASLVKINIRNSEMKGCSLETSSLSNVLLDNCHCEYLNLTNSNATNLTANTCYFKKAHFVNTNLTAAVLNNCDWNGANLTGAILKRANLKGAKNLTVEQLLSCKDITYLCLDEPLASDERIRVLTKKQ